MWVRDRFKRKPAKNFNLDVDVMNSLESLARQQQRTPEEIVNILLDEAVRSRDAQAVNWKRWQSLSPREQEVAALICLNYTTRQIAAKLHISPVTVKTHAEHILYKFDLNERTSLRLMLKDWDFSAWDR